MRQFKQKSFIVGKCDIFCRKMRQLINFFLYLDLDQMKVSLDLKLTTCEDCDMLMTKNILFINTSAITSERQRMNFVKRPPISFSLNNKLSSSKHSYMRSKKVRSWFNSQLLYKVKEATSLRKWTTTCSRRRSRTSSCQHSKWNKRQLQVKSCTVLLAK